MECRVEKQKLLRESYATALISTNATTVNSAERQGRDLKL